MKNYIIIPANQTEGMSGYSAMAIEHTPENIAEIERMFKILKDAQSIDLSISRITYDYPRLDVELFNDDFEPMVDKIHIEELEDDLVEEYLEIRESKVQSVVVEISNEQVKISYDAEFSDSQVYCDFTSMELKEVLTDN